MKEFENIACVFGQTPSPIPYLWTHLLAFIPLLISFKKLKKAVPLKGGRELFSEKKVRRGFFTYRIAINRTTRGKPLRLQSLIALESTSPLRAGTFFNKLFC